MRIFYLLIFFLLIHTLGFTQTLVVYDRSNVLDGEIGTSNNASGVSSTGFNRNNVNRATNNANHTSNAWGSTSLGDALTGQEYVEWTVSASPTFIATINELDLRLRRNNSGPEFAQIFYSTDGFATAGIDVSGVISLPTSVTAYNFPGLGIITSGTVTFRLYAWHETAVSGGWVRIQRSTAFNGLGSTNVAARLIGTAVSTSPNSTESDIISNGGETDNIDYANFNVSSGLNTTNAEQIAEFTIRDGGATSPDSDSEATILEAIEFNVVNPDFIQALAIYDGLTLVEEVTNVTSLTSFSNLNGGAGIIAPDDGSKSFQVYATFTTSVVDNDQIQLIINSASTPASGSSLFEFGDAGGAQTSTAGDANRIEVTAGNFLYTQNTSEVNQFEPMIPGVEILAVDSNSNLDLDYVDLVSFFVSGTTFDLSAETAVNAVNGTATFNNLVFGETGTNVTITAFATGFINTPSAPFDVINPFLVLAIQDFDGSGPEWGVTNNTDYFNNGWGVDGYYGPIDISLAAPLNWPFFSGNILGENDLDDLNNGNGTNVYARLTFDNTDVSGFNNIKIVFDWQVVGYAQNRNDVRYRLRLDGALQSWVFLFDGNGIPTDDQGRVEIDIPDGIENVGFQIEVRNSLITAYSGFDNFRLVSEFDGLIYRNGTWFPSAPTDLTGTEDVIISSGTYTVNSPIEVNNFIIDPSTNVEIDPGQTMLINGTLTNNGSLTLNSTSSAYSSILPASVEANTTADYNRFVNIAGTAGGGGNDLISIPLMPDAGQTFDEFIALGSPTTNADKLATNGVVYAFAPFNTTTGNYENFSITSTDALTRGAGYRVATTTGENLTFSGNVVTGDVTGVTITNPVGGNEWNLVGNPYPSYLNSQGFLTANAAAFDPNSVGIYGYNSGTFPGVGTVGNFTIISFVSNPTINVAPGQGFFVAAPRTPGASSTIDFTSSMRSLEGDDDFIIGFAPSENENPNFRLSLSSDDVQRTTEIYFHENGTLGLDPGYDASTFGNGINNFDLYTHLVEENEGRPMMVQTLNSVHVENARVPLGVHASQGQQLIFNAAYSNLTSDIEVILEDALTNTFTRLNASDYVLNLNNNVSGTGRFYLNFGTNSLSNEQFELDNIQIYASNNQEIHVRGNLKDDSKIFIYDIQGRMVHQSELSSTQNQHVINANHLSKGVYLIQLTNTFGGINKKIILR